MTRLIRCVGSILLLLCAVTTVMASPKVTIAPQPAWLLPRQPDLQKTVPDKQAANGYYVKLYDEQTNAGDHTEYLHIMRQIVNETGVQANSEITIQFSGEYQQLLFHKLFIIRNGQVVNKLSPTAYKVSKVEDALGSHQLSDNYQAVIVLTDLRKGDCIDMAYSLKGANPVFEGKYTGIVSFVATTPILNFYATVMIPEGRRLIIRNFNNADNPNISRRNGYVVYDWPKMSIDAYESTASNTPSWFADFPYSEMSEYNMWYDVAQWGMRLVDNYSYNLTADMKQKVAVWQKQSGGNAATYAELATRFVQDDIRYHGVEIGINTTKPHSPAETFANRYGDCKDKSMLLVALLRANNIPAWMMLVNTAWKHKMVEHLPSHYFNHAIVKTIVSGDDIWIDPTIQFQRGAIANIYLPDYKKGLVIDSLTNSLEDIYQSNNGSIELIEEFTVPEDEDEAATLKITTTYTNGQADMARDKLSAGISSLKALYEEYYSRIWGKTTMTDSLSPKDDLATNVLTLDEQYSIDKIWKKNDKGKYVIEINAWSIYERLVKPETNDLTKPFALVYPCNIEYRMVFNMPDNWPITPVKFEIDRDAYFFDCSIQSEGRTVYMFYNLRNKKDFVEPADLKQYAEDYEKITNALSYNFTFDKELVGNINAVNAKGVSHSVNWIMVFVALVTAGISVFALIKADTKESALTSHQWLPDNISGWLYLLAFVLVIRPPVYVYNLVAGNYFRTDVWMNLNAIGATGLQLVLMIELVSRVVLLLLSGWVIYWFFRKRDVFPRMFMILAFTEMGVSVFSILAGYIMPSLEELVPGYTMSAWKVFFKAVIFAGIWVTAIKYSPIIQRVFIRPYKYKPVHTPPSPEPSYIQLSSEAPLNKEKQEEEGINENVS